MFEVKSVDEVLRIIDESFSGYTLESETVDIRDAVGRITADDVAAPEDIPGFNRSSVDGYAVISSDTFGSSDSLPSQLKLAGEVSMGERPAVSLEKGQAAYVPTGGELPLNADAMVMVEHTEDFEDGFVYINKPSAPGNHVVFKGDDLKSGNIVIKAGSRLKPQDIGALAAMGCTTVSMKRRVRVGIISTGDEIVYICEKPEGSKVRDVNSYSLYAGVAAYGGEPRMYGITGDDCDRIREVVERALSECDIALVSGGSSVGMRDETYKVIDSLGQPGVLVHGIAVKPGKPTILGKVRGKAVIGLPGHPASAYVIFRFFVYYLMDLMNGVHSRAAGTARAVMVCNYPSNHGREEFVPVRLEGTGERLTAHPIFGKSGLITLLTRADGYVRVGRGSEGIGAGEEVTVVLF